MTTAPIPYDQCRCGCGKKLNDPRKKYKKGHRPGNGTVVQLVPNQRSGPPTLPEVDYENLVPDLVQFIRRYVVLTDEQALVLAVYVLHTYIAHLCQQTPYVFIHSPEPGCGKSRLMEVLELLVARPWMIVTPPDAVLFRQVDAKMPTLLWDEIDAVFSPKTAQYHEEKRGMIDQGHRSRGRVPRFIGDKVMEFRVYCPKVFAGIGSLPDTLADRSIPIALQRKRTDEHVDDFIFADAEIEAERLKERIDAWADEHAEEVAVARPDNVPDEMSDRMKEGCFSLMTIADRADLGAELRSALVMTLTGNRIDVRENLRMQLLRDVRTVFAEAYAERGKVVRAIRTATLLEHLRTIEESPWDNYYGRGLNAQDLASLLGHYNLHPRNLGKNNNAKGYRREPVGDDAGLADVWVRYLGADETGGTEGYG